MEVGGGIRNLETIDTYLKSGVERVILGSAALKNPQLVKDAVQKFGSQHIAVGIDAKNGMVAQRLAGRIRHRLHYTGKRNDRSGCAVFYRNRHCKRRHAFRR